MTFPIVTLTTDFGTVDGYIGAMKGILYSKSHHHIRVVDITHAIPPQHIISGMLCLERSVPYFPEKTIHIAVIDPGVGSTRKTIAVFSGDQYFIGPDNGLFTPFYSAHSCDVVSIENETIIRSQVSNTFHGRDIFAPAAAWLCNGGDFYQLGPLLKNPITLAIPTPVVSNNTTILGQIIAVDHFGNLISNIKIPLTSHPTKVVCSSIEKELPFITHYDEQKESSPAALQGSDLRIEIGVPNGSAFTWFQETYNIDPYHMDLKITL